MGDDFEDEDEFDEDDEDVEEDEVVMRDPKAFRRDLDAILSRRDPAALRAFLIEQEQWTEETTTDPETAMWLMIAASPAHRALHPEAEAWLRGHGHAAESEAILGERGGGGGKSGGKGQRAGGRGGPPRGGGNRPQGSRPGQHGGSQQHQQRPSGPNQGRPGQGGRGPRGGLPSSERGQRPPRYS